MSGSKEKTKLRVVEGGKGKEKPSNPELKGFTNLRQEIAILAEALDAKFSAAEMGEGSEKALGKKYSGLLSDLVGEMDTEEAYKAYDPYHRVFMTEIKTGAQLAKYMSVLSDAQAGLDELESEFDIELERNRSGDDIRNALAA